MQHPNTLSHDSTESPPTFMAWVRSVTTSSVRLLVVLVAFAALLLAEPVFAQETVHVVAVGENLSTIARRYGMTMQDLAAYNGIVNPNIVFVGQQLEIPGSGLAPQTLAPAGSDALPGEQGYYTVGAGDTLSDVARRFGMTTGDLLRLNGIDNANFIYVGQHLRVSARVPAVTAHNEQTPKLQAADEIYVVRAGDTLATIAARHGTTTQELLVANGLPNPNFVWVGQRLRVRASGATQTPLNLIAAPADGQRWIEVNLTEQTLTAWQGDVAVLRTTISSGRASTPTVTGRFAIGTKYQAQRMIGPGYDLPNVPWVMYFYSGYAIHGTYWHNNFGTPMSHGCVNMRTNEAEMLYEWAPPGTEVYVHY